jgi:hypothetical protein
VRKVPGSHELAESLSNPMDKQDPPLTDPISPPLPPYVPKYPEFYGSHFNVEWFDEKFLELFSSIKSLSSSSTSTSLDELTRLKLLTQVGSGIYSFPCFKSTFCHQLLEESVSYIQYAQAYDLPIARPNSMNRYGLVLNLIGMRDLLSHLQHEYLHPISFFFFPIESTTKAFTDHHSFIVSYEPSRDRSLDLHTDDSEVTWNLCLGNEFTGSGLTFCGVMATAAHRQYQCSYQHQLGHAVVHLGRQRHGAETITSGERHNLIIWCRNESYRESEAYQLSLRRYERESNPPDVRCVSYTHDRDYLLYHDNYPRGKNPFHLSDGRSEDDNSGSSGEEEHQQGEDLPMPWCPPVRFGYDGIPTPNHLMKIVYTRLVEEEEEEQRKRSKRKRRPLRSELDRKREGEQEQDSSPATL